MLGEQDLALLQEEAREVYGYLEDATTLSYTTMNRDPEITAHIITRTLNIVENLTNYLRGQKPFLKDPKLRRNIDDRINLALKIKNFSTFKWNPDSIVSGYQPPIQDVATDALFSEYILGNLSCSVEYLAQLVEGREINDILKELNRILMENEAMFIRPSSKQSRTCLKGKSSGQRAKWFYAVELYAMERYKGPNVFEEIEDSGDYTALYGRKGIHLQLKSQQLIKKRKSLKNLNASAILADGKVYYPQVRELFKKYIPPYKSIHVV